MALTLQRFANGDTNYIAKHNANADGLEAAVNGLQTQLATSFGASISIGDALLSIFGGSLALVGSASYTATVRWGHRRPVLRPAAMGGVGDRDRCPGRFDLRLWFAGLGDRALVLQLHREEARCQHR